VSLEWLTLGNASVFERLWDVALHSTSGQRAGSLASDELIQTTVMPE
jgi:hypothetical protein